MFSVSNIAWLPDEESRALDLLGEAGISYIEVAPARIWAAGADTPLASVREAMRLFSDSHIEISGCQAILFGKPDLVLFEDSARPALLEYLKRLAAICSAAGGKYLVWGAPKNRWIPDGMDHETAFRTAVDFFQELGKEAEKQGVWFGIEANAADYGCNFCTHVTDVGHVVRAVDSPGIRWHLDTGELAMNSEAVPGVILQNADILGSVHVSQPGLGDFVVPWAGHSSVAAALQKLSYHGPITLEMKRPASGLNGVREAISFLLTTYSC